MTKRSMNSLKVRIILFAGLLMLITAFSSCSSAKKAVRAPLKVEGEAFLLRKLRENQMDFSSLNAKFEAIYSVNKSDSKLNGQIRIFKDSAIWISITPALGIEAARFLFTPDSIKFLNRMNNTYMEKSFSYINELINTSVDFDMLQSLLMGNDFSLYDTTNFKAQVDGGLYKLQTNNRRKVIRNIRKNELDASFPIQTLWLDPETFKLRQILLKEADKETQKFTAWYNNHQNVNEQWVPVNLIFEVKTEKDKVNITVDLSKVTINQEITIPYRVPDDYTKIEELKKKEE